MNAAEDCLQSCAQIVVEIEAEERLPRPENLEVSSKYVLTATFSSSSTQQKSRTTSWQAEDDDWKVREETVHSKRVGKTNGMTLGIKKLGQKSPAVPRSAREDEGRCVLMEDRRRRRTAFENVAKEMLRYLDNRDDVKVDVTESQERLEVPVQIGTPI